jgi:hypothetical protein
LTSRLGCSDEVSTLTARLCTFEGHLAQGLITSPILADYSVRRLDARVAGVALAHRLVYSRFVDDINLSGQFRLDLNSSGLVQLVRRIIHECKFNVAARKEKSGRVTDGEISITGFRFHNGHLDPVADYLQRLQATLEAHRMLGLNGPFDAQLCTEAQLQGRVNYVCSINRNRRRSLRSLLGSINWERVQRNALERGLIISHKRLRRIAKPNSFEQLGDLAIPNF